MVGKIERVVVTGMGVVSPLGCSIKFSSLPRSAYSPEPRR